MWFKLESEQEKIIPDLAKAYISNLIKKNKLLKEECITIYTPKIRELLNKMKNSNIEDVWSLASNPTIEYIQYK